MPIVEQSTRTLRYENRCSKKNIELQKKQREERYEKRCAMKQEAKESVSEDLEQRTSIRRTSSRLSETPFVYGLLGSYFK